MSDSISVGNENSGSDSIGFGDSTALASFRDSPAEQDIAPTEKAKPFDEMRAVADQLRGQISITDVAPNVPGENATEPAPTTSSLLSERFTDRVKTLDDQELANKIKSKEAQLRERNEQLQLAEQTEDNAGAIANGLGLATSVLGLGGSLARGIASTAASFGISVGGEDAVASVAGNSADVAFNEATRLGVEVAALKNEQEQRAGVAQPLDGAAVTGKIPDRPDTVQPLPERITPPPLSNNATEPAPTTSSLLSERFTDRVKTLDDQELANKIKSKEAQLRERNEQLQLAEQTEDNAGAIANGLGLAASVLGLGGSLARGIASTAASFGISVGGEDLVAGVAGNSADFAFDEAARLGVKIAALKTEQEQRAEVSPPLGGPELTGEIPDRPDTAESLPDQIASERETAKAEREKQSQFENIADNDPAFRDQALQEAEKAAERAAAADSRANNLQAKQNERVNALAAAEERAALDAAAETREERRRELNDRSEPNGGQVSGADRGVGRGDVPDSF